MSIAEKKLLARLIAKSFSKEMGDNYDSMTTEQKEQAIDILGQLIAFGGL